MGQESRSEIIEVLDCDIDVRPKAAPGIGDLLPLVGSVRRAGESLLIEFEPDAEASLGAFVEAERLCCAGIGWEIQRERGLMLRISASDYQLDVLEGLWRSALESANIEKVQ